MLVDSHCHLADEVYNADLPDVIERSIGNFRKADPESSGIVAWAKQLEPDMVMY